MTIQIHKSWEPFLGQEFQKPYLQRLSSFLEEERRSGHQVFPEREAIFRALQWTSWDAVKVVILGQDPYPTPGDANGLAFAVDQGRRLPASLRNIFRELEASTEFQPWSGVQTLEHWARQGVLLLNRVLTVRAGAPHSHRNRGWERFTEAVISAVNQKPETVFFLLWGRAAQSLRHLIQSPPHRLLQTTHPSPLSAHRGFLGCRHFQKVNAALQELGKLPIRW